MTDHPTLEPTSAVRNRAGEPSGVPPAAAFVDVICADHELLDAEFNAIIAANFPDAARGGQLLRPGTAVTTATRRVPARRMAAGSIRGAVRGCAGAAHNLRARQRGPPGQPMRANYMRANHTGTRENRDVEAGHEQEVVVSTDTTHHPRARMRPAGHDHLHSRASTC